VWGLESSSQVDRFRSRFCRDSNTQPTGSKSFAQEKSIVPDNLLLAYIDSESGGLIVSGFALLKISRTAPSVAGISRRWL